MNKAIVIAVLLASAALGGCATHAGPQAINETDRLESLETGRTTKQRR